MLLEKERGRQPVEPFVEKRLSGRISRETYYKWVKQETNCLYDLQRFYAVLDRLFEAEKPPEEGQLSRLVALAQPEPVFNMAAERLPASAVPREDKINEVVNRLRVLRRQPQSAKGRIEGRTVVLSGGRGYGKTTLAAACGTDPRIRSYFPGGIGWLALGEPQTLKRQVEDLIHRMEHADRARIRGFQDLLPQKKVSRIPAFNAVLEQLAATLGERQVLLVMDDVGERETLDVIYQALVSCPNCYALLTTRYDTVLHGDAQPIRVEGMREDEAVAVLQQGLPDLGDIGRTDEWDTWKTWVVGAVRFQPLRITRIRDAIVESLASRRPLKQVLGQIQARLQQAGSRAFDAPRLEPPFHLLLPAESVLKIGESDSLSAKMFRKTGPVAVDFDAGMVHRREQVSEVQAMLKQNVPAVLLQGVAASGKSVIARQVAYELWQDDWTVYMHMLNRSERLQQRVKLQEEIGVLARERTLVVIEDVHLASPMEINHMLLALDQQPWPKLLLTSRKIEVEDGESDNVPNRLRELSRIKLEPFDPAKRIIELFFQKERIPAQEAWIDEVKKASRTSLWLLAVALESIDVGAVRKGRWAGMDSDVMKRRVREYLGELQRDHSENKLYPKLLIALSVLYRFEIPTAERFLEDVFPEAGQMLAQLARLGETVPKGTGLYGLPHSALADLYFEFACDPKWGDSLYCDEKAFFRRYVTSDNAVNADDLFGWNVSSDWVQGLTQADIQAFVRRIETAKTLWGAAGYIVGIQAADPAKGDALWAALNRDQLVRRIETTEDVGDAAWCIAAIQKADPSKGDALWAALGLDRWARQIEAAANLNAAWCITRIQNVDPAKGDALWAALNMGHLARRIEAAAGLSAAAWCIARIQDVDPAKGDALWAALNLDQWARRIETAEDLRAAASDIAMIQRADPDKGKALVAALNLDHWARRIEEAQDLKTAAWCIATIHKADPGKGDELWATLNLDQWARRIETAEDLGDAASCIATIQRADPGKGKALVAVLKLDQWAHRIETAEDLGSAAGCIEAIQRADPGKGKTLVAAVQLDRWAGRIETAEDLRNAALCIVAIQHVDQDKAAALWTALKLGQWPRQSRSGAAM